MSPLDLHCCQVACALGADYEIIDKADSNPYTCVLHSCEAHVGELLTHDASLPADAEDHWEIRRLEEAELSDG
jgi:hypothetical protein